MAEAHVDHPGEVSWFAGHGPKPVTGPCQHDCPHDMLSTIAWGPDYDHYTLLQCDVREPGGCAKQCRAWSIEYPHPFTAGPKFKLADFLTVAAVSGSREAGGEGE